MNSEKIKQLYEISKEQEERFIQSLKELMDNPERNHLDIDEINELFKLIRGAEYRRGKEDGIEQEKKNLLDEINRLAKLPHASPATPRFDTASQIYLNWKRNFIEELREFLGDKK